MASIISAGTTSATALNMSADTSGVLQLASNNGTVALTVSTSQFVGIGITSPAFQLSVQTAVAAVNTTAESQVHVVNSTSDIYLYNSYSANTFGIFDGTASQQRVIYNRANSRWEFYTGASEKLRLDASGRLMLGTTSVDGSISNDASLIGGRFKTASGSLVGGGSGAWFDAFTVTQPGLYILHAYIGGYNAGPGDWSNAWMISYTGGNNPYVATAMGATGNVQARTKPGSTTTIQLYLGAGAGITYTWATQRID